MPLPLVGLAGLAIQAAPTIARWLGGGEAEAVTKRVADVAAGIFGTTNPDEIQAAIASDPDKALQFKLGMAAIDSEYDQRRHEEVLAVLRDVQDARAMQMANKSQWPYVIGLLLILGLFGITFYMMIWGITPGQGGSEALMIMLGTIGGGVMAFIGWMYGSTASSFLKTQVMDRLTR